MVGDCEDRDEEEEQSAPAKRKQGAHLGQERIPWEDWNPCRRVENPGRKTQRRWRTREQPRKHLWRWRLHWH
ncbi:unnamed protein product [Linum trigynum]|uniref:Uncharacterized protein n=1 Tax=Linum trigynum TaxID=586398 RepID=A0AAV2CQU8_9ROSI